MSHKYSQQKGIIPAIVAIIAALVALGILMLVLFLALYLRHLIAGLVGGEGQPGGNLNYGAGNCATTASFSNLEMPARKGKIVREQHWVTTSESFPGGWPSSAKDQIERHYQLTNFNFNCSGCPKEGWTPSAGGGNIGGGNTIKPPLNYEPWMMNMQWKQNGRRVPGPSPGTKMIITSTKTGKSVVAIAGYEWGPEEGSRWIAGATSEVLKALGIDTDGEVEIGFAQDQSSMPGPIICVTPGSASGNSIVNAARGELGKHYNDDCTIYNDYAIGGSRCWAWCAAFVTWVYNQAGIPIERTGGTVRLMEIFKNGHTFALADNRSFMPAPGDVFWMRANNSSGYHVGIVEYIEGNLVHTIEGNVTGDVVAKRTHNRSELYAFGRW